MSDLDDLYQEILLDHGRRPRNFGKLLGHNRIAQGHNPMCGDRFTVYAILGDDGTVESVGFDGMGCAISTASASLMTQTLKGCTPEEVTRRCERFQAALVAPEEPSTEGLGKLSVLLGVRRFPMRVKCATLAWHTVRAAVSGGEPDVPVTTE